MDELRETYDIDFNVDLSGLRREFQLATSYGQSFARSLTTAFSDVIVKGKSLGDAFRSLALRLSELAIKAAFRPLETMIAGGFSRMFAGAMPFAQGGAFSNGLPVPFAKGGVVAAPVLFPLAQGRTGLMGERGPEAIMPLARGPDGRLGVQASGGGSVNITFNVATSDVESFRRSEARVLAMLSRAVDQSTRHT
ncbi:MAG: phage tail tape measure protein [Hyphomicrobiaceae bacterium]